MRNKRSIIAIDGPAASGKGSLSKYLAKELNLFHMETGLYYRVFAFQYKKTIKISDEDKTFMNIKKNLFNYKIDRNELFDDKISNLASILAKKKKVRDIIFEQQRAVLTNFPSAFKGIILEGRDCGTVIAPEANVKIFLVSDLNVRAKRRYLQIKHKTEVKYEKVFKELASRDKRDKERKHSPLKKAKDAIELDNSNISLEETINIVKKIIFSTLPYLKK